MQNIFNIPSFYGLIFIFNFDPSFIKNIINGLKTYNNVDNK